MELTPGTRVDRYVLIEPLGEGGQGAVWKARDPLDAERPCAIKLVPASAARPADLERARREARALARLEHPSLVRCHALFEDLKLGVLGIAMELVDGTSLRALANDPRLDAERRHDVLLHVARALAYLHDSGVVHRDVKLDNVLVRSNFFDDPKLPDSVKVVDLGIAAVSGSEQLTAVGTVVGTVPYLAPELVDPATFEGDASSPAVDVFAFGVMGWLLLSGQHPTGLPARASFVDYTRAYRAGLQPGHAWPDAKSDDSWTGVLSQALSLSPSLRIPDGRALVDRLEGRAMDAVSNAPSLVGTPTSVASPRAMRADTALHASAPVSEIRSVARHAATVELAGANARAKAGARPGRGFTWLVLGVVGLAAAVGVGVAVNLNEQPAPALTAPPSAHAPAVSAPAIRAEPLEASTTEAEDAADGEGGVTAAETLLDPCDAGCFSGRSCGDAGCAGVLDVDEGFTLRAGALLDSEGRLLAATYRTAELCVAVSGFSKPPTCAKLADTLDGGIPEAGLYVNTVDLTDHGIDMEVRVVIPNVGASVLAEQKTVRFAEGVPRSALCKGLEVDLTGDGDVHARVRFYLDDQNPKLRPTRCAER